MKTCRNPNCDRRVSPSRNLDNYGACHRCLEIINVFRWLVEGKVMNEDPDPLRERAKQLGVVLP